MSAPIAKPIGPEATSELIEAIRSFPLFREVRHCGFTFQVSPFEIYANCPHCAAQLKVRSFSAAPELEDVFDAVFEWLNQPEALRFAEERQRVLAQTD